METWTEMPISLLVIGKPNLAEGEAKWMFHEAAPQNSRSEATAVLSVMPQME
jgi:hypothetical protein